MPSLEGLQNNSGSSLLTQQRLRLGLLRDLAESISVGSTSVCALISVHSIGKEFIIVEEYWNLKYMTIFAKP